MACQPFRRLQQLHATFKTDKGCTEIVVATITYGSNFSIVFLIRCLTAGLFCQTS